jgi:predicted small secreted protein
MRKTLLMSLIATMTLALTACNTIAGAGKDLERAGEKIQGAAKK